MATPHLQGGAAMQREAGDQRDYPIVKVFPQKPPTRPYGRRSEVAFRRESCGIKQGQRNETHSCGLPFACANRKRCELGTTSGHIRAPDGMQPCNSNAEAELKRATTHGGMRLAKQRGSNIKLNTSLQATYRRVKQLSLDPFGALEQSPSQADDRRVGGQPLRDHNYISWKRGEPPLIDRFINTLEHVLLSLPGRNPRLIHRHLDYYAKVMGRLNRQFAVAYRAAIGAHLPRQCRRKVNAKCEYAHSVVRTSAYGDLGKRLPCDLRQVGTTESLRAAALVNSTVKRGSLPLDEPYWPYAPNRQLSRQKWAGVPYPQLVFTVYTRLTGSCVVPLLQK
uniref:Uncharacterized protein n=1 Tax=Trichuris muris TaxID=70415 RepID=A0A5S6Q7T9_TRIMR